ncbi:hypothetical protein LSAT2_014940 [Lamellibrachia satsuma]|nr:hypothetical protein LSAT2_014940 [Lamellibrachia satsuma]
MSVHRVLVTRLSGRSISGQPEYAQVEFVDNGGGDTVKTEHLYDLPTCLADVPYQASVNSPMFYESSGP